MMPRSLCVEQAHGDSVYGLAFSPDGKRLVSGGNDNCVRAWLLEPDASGAHMSYLGVRACACMRVCIVYVCVRLRMWSYCLRVRHAYGRHARPCTPVNAGQRRSNSPQRHDDAVNGVAWSPDGRFVVSASDEMEVRVISHGFMELCVL